MKNRKKVLLLDLYGVIIEESKGNFIPYTREHLDAEAYERALKLIREERYFTRAQLGELSSDEFLGCLGYPKPREAMEDYLENYLTLDGQFRAFADAYRERFDFYLLSNDLWEWNDFLLDYHRLNSYFKGKIVSGRVKSRKPDERIFQYALERVGRAPDDQVLFVDNSVKNLLAAERLGIRTILFNRDRVEYGGQTVNDFAELGELITN